MKKVLGLGIAGLGTMALGMAIREVSVRREKEMMAKLSSTLHRIGLVTDHIKLYVGTDRIDPDYMMKSETYKKLIKDSYQAESIMYYLMNAGDLNDNDKKTMKEDVKRLYEEYVLAFKEGGIMIEFREKVEKEIQEIKKAK